MRRLPMISFLFLVLCATTVVAQSPSAAGTWDATLTSPEGTFNVQLILKQDGEKLSGVVKSSRGETPIEGTTNGKDIKLKYTIKYQDNDMIITLTGALDGASIKGSADYGGLADGEFNAKRASDAGAATTKPPDAPPTKPPDVPPTKPPDVPPTKPPDVPPTKPPDVPPTKPPDVPPTKPPDVPPTKPPASTTSASDKTDISGAWSFQVESSAGVGSPTFTFKQDGEKLGGQYKGAFGEAPLTGTVKGNKVDFVIKVEAQGQPLTITYTGTVEKDGGMKGTAELGEIGSATWTAKRQ